MAQTEARPELQRLKLDTSLWDNSKLNNDNPGVLQSEDQALPAHLASSDCLGVTQHKDGAHEDDVGRPGRLRWQDHDPTLRVSSEHLEKKQQAMGEHGARRPSITFHPQVTLDDGNKQSIEKELPRQDSHARPRGRSMMQELVNSEVVRSRTRTQSESDRHKFDKVTGELIPLRGRGRRDWGYDQGQCRWPLLQTTVDELASDQRADEAQEERDSVPSLVSGITASPPSNMIETPRHMPADHAMSPISTSSPIEFPSLNDSGTLPSPRPRGAQRVKSYHIDRTKGMRQESRRSSARSGSSAKSPASAFLSRFSRGSSVSTPSPDDDGQTIGHDNEYVIGREVGYGGFSVIKEAHTIENGQQMLRAVKIVRKRFSNRTDEENEKLQIEYEHEVSMWRCLKHGNILPLMSVLETPFATFCITLMNTGGTLFDLVQSRRKGFTKSQASLGSPLASPDSDWSMVDAGIPIPVVRRYLGQLAEAIRYLHQDMHIVHRDIKMENCLVTNPSCSVQGGELGNILLCDFGMAEFISQDDRDNAILTSSLDGNDERFNDDKPPHNIGPSDTSTNVQGSLQYASPELIKASRPLYIPAIDIWAFGVVSYGLLTAELPFTHSFLPKLQMMILKGEWNLKTLEEAIDKGSDDFGDSRSAIELVAKCLTREPGPRWTVQEILECKFLGLPESFHAAFQSSLPRRWV